MFNINILAKCDTSTSNKFYKLKITRSMNIEHILLLAIFASTATNENDFRETCVTVALLLPFISCFRKK